MTGSSSSSSSASSSYNAAERSSSSSPSSDVPLEDKPKAKERDKEGNRNGSRRTEILRLLTCTQNTSALVFSVFLTVHLASPLMAVFGGISTADRTMMIARDLYLPLEPVLIYIPLTVHIASSITKRGIISASTSTSSSPTSTSFISRIKRYLPKQPHQILAYPLLLLVIPHILTHRIIPSSSTYPINKLSPSELGWEFVGYNLSSRPGTTYISYAALVATATWHSLVGGMKVVSWLKSLRKRKQSPATASTESQSNVRNLATDASTPTSRISSKRKIGLRSFVLAFTGLITLGLVRVANASHPSLGLISPIMKKRYDAVLSAPWSLAWR